MATPLFKEVDWKDVFIEGAARKRDSLALQMILHGQFPSRGWRIAETVYNDNGTIRYACFPLAPV